MERTKTDQENSTIVIIYTMEHFSNAERTLEKNILKDTIQLNQLAGKCCSCRRQ